MRSIRASDSFNRHTRHDGGQCCRRCLPNAKVRHRAVDTQPVVPTTTTRSATWDRPKSHSSRSSRSWASSIARSTRCAKRDCSRARRAPRPPAQAPRRRPRSLRSSRFPRRPYRDRPARPPARASGVLSPCPARTTAAPAGNGCNHGRTFFEHQSRKVVRMNSTGRGWRERPRPGRTMNQDECSGAAARTAAALAAF